MQGVSMQLPAGGKAVKRPKRLLSADHRRLQSCVGTQARCVRKDTHARVVWGYAPSGKFCKFDALRVLLRPILAQSGTSVIVGLRTLCERSKLQC